jgi:hypothetical protein
MIYERSSNGRAAQHSKAFSAAAKAFIISSSEYFPSRWINAAVRHIELLGRAVAEIRTSLFANR